MKHDPSLCLLCKKKEKDCECEGGFKVFYYHGKPVSHKEIEHVKTIPEVKEDIQDTIDILKKFGF
jgi:hypothetical protein